jgi:transcriptional regulator with XRE-family HTH domain
MRTTWSKLAKSREYRSQIVSATARRAFAFQLRAIMKKRDLSQEKLAEMCGLSQGVISRAADPNYGKLTVTLKTKIANGLDMAYIGNLVPFTDAERWLSGLSEEAVQVPTFVEENAVREKATREAEIALYKQRTKKLVSIDGASVWAALKGDTQQDAAGGLNGSGNDPKSQSTGNDGIGLFDERGTGTYQ